MLTASTKRDSGDVAPQIFREMPSYEGLELVKYTRLVIVCQALLVDV